MGITESVAQTIVRVIFRLLLPEKYSLFKQVGLRNLLIYKKRQRNQKNILETWYIISNLSSSE